MKIFGFEIRKQQTELGALVPPKTEDGTHDQVSYGSGAAMYGYSFDIEGRYRSESERIQKYRSMAMSPEIDMAIEEITSEAIVIEDDKPPMSLSVFAEKNEIPDAVRKSITDEFDNVVSLLRLNTDGHDLFRRWYVDGRYYAHLVVDESNVAEGIKDIRQLDSRKTKKIREIIKSKTPDGVEVVSGTEEYFIYNDKGLASTESTALRLSPDVLLYAPSGLMDEAGTVISHIHKSIKPYNQLRYMEDACLIYTLSRAPQRRVFYIDVADMPKQKAEQYIQDVMNRYKNKVVYNNSTGEISDDRVHQCLTMDTKVPLLDGRTLTLSEISEEYKNKDLWTYSCDPITGKFVPGKITWAGVSRPNAQLMRITLDNGKTIDCTPDHKFPVWGKNMVQAQDLSVGDSMIPLYRKTAPVINGVSNEYEMIWKNDEKEWNFTHREVSEWKDVVGMNNEFIFNEEYRDLPKKTVHHVNINRFDNSPENLMRMNSKDHLKYHKSSGSGTGKVGGKRSAELGRSKENYAKGRVIFAEKMKDSEYNSWFRNQQRNGWTEAEKKNASERAIKNNLSHLGNLAKIELWKSDSKKIEHRSMYAVEYTTDMFDIIKNNAAKMTKVRIAELINESTEIINSWKTLNSKKCISASQKSFDFVTHRDVVRIVEQFSGLTFAQLKEQSTFRNHKIAKIEFLDERADTGCLTIDGDEKYHNYHTFALDAGIYTQNSVLEDYWLPRRSNGRTTEITTLPGDSVMSNMDNIMYFMNKLYASLNLPQSRVKADQSGFNLGRASEITRDEVKFSKFVNRLRIKFAEIPLQALS
jgi:Bacteriophage T4-like portal protein (Gp20)/Intein splicing domain